MKLYSHVVLIAAVAMPMLCQTAFAQKASAGQDLAFADQIEKVAAQSEKIAAQADRMAAQAEKVATQAFSSDRMADLNEQIARAKAQFDSGAFADVDVKVEAAMDKLHSLSDLSVNMNFDDLKFNFDSDKFADLNGKLKDLQFNLDTKSFDFDKATAKFGETFGEKFGNTFGDMAFLQAAQAGKPFPPEPPTPPAAAAMAKIRTIQIGRGGDGEYDQGTRALDQHHYEEAALRFDAVINSRSSTRADGALYWKAYALNRAGKRDEALAAITQLRRDYSSSAWLNDANALEAEVKQNGGQPISPAQETNEDLKLLAINSLMNADSERAIPLIEGMLKSSAAPNIKDRALFVLAQSKAPRAQQVLTDYAKGSGNPDMQLHAIQYVGMSRTKESQQLLASIYASSGDARVKNSVLQQLMNARAYDALLNIAKTEKDPSLKNSAIRNLASDKSASGEALLELYSSSDAQAKKAIVEGFQSRHDAKTLVDLARKESDPSMKRYLVERLAGMRDSKEAMDYMMELLKQ